MSFSSIDLCSKALNKIGANSITSFDEGSIESEICESIYLTLKQKLLSMYTWNFAIKTENLSLSDINGMYGYLYAYTLPLDFLRAVKISTGAKYKIIGNCLFCNEENVSLEYVADVNESCFSPLFVSSFIYLLSAELSIALLNDVSKYSLFYRLFNSEFKEAKSIESMQESNKSLKNFSLIDIRK